MFLYCIKDLSDSYVQASYKSYPPSLKETAFLNCDFCWNDKISADWESYYDYICKNKPHEMKFKVWDYDKSGYKWPDFMGIDGVTFPCVGLLSERLLELLFGVDFISNKLVFEAKLEIEDQSKLSKKLKIKEKPRYYWFLPNAFYQIETIFSLTLKENDMYCKNCGRLFLKKAYKRFQKFYNNDFLLGYPFILPVVDSEIYICNEFHTSNKIFVKKDIVKKIIDNGLVGIQIHPSDKTRWGEYSDYCLDVIDKEYHFLIDL